MTRTFAESGRRDSNPLTFLTSARRRIRSVKPLHSVEQPSPRPSVRSTLQSGPSVSACGCFSWRDEMLRLFVRSWAGDESTVRTAT